MWRDSEKYACLDKKDSNNRLRLVVVVVFLLIGVLIGRLFLLQVKDSDYYTALAAGQQQIFSKLSPERGQIFFSSVMPGDSDGLLFPLATNKNFALLYAVPKDVADPRAMAEKLYNFFDKPLMEKENSRLAQENEKKKLRAIQDIQDDETLKPEEKTAKIATIASDPIFSADSRKEEIIAGYLKHLDKPGDPYEPLVKKMSTEDLLKLYAAIYSESTSTPGLISTTSSVRAQDLDILHEQIVNTADNNRPLDIKGLGYEFFKYRYYPEGDNAAHLAGFVDTDGVGHYGLEGFFNSELTGTFGFLRAEKGVGRNMLIVNDQEYVKPEDGSDLVLTIDRNVEFAVCDQLKAAIEKYNATGGSVIVGDPKTGAIIAMCSYPAFDPNDYKSVEDIQYFNNPTIFSQYEPGSVMKTITMAAGIDQGKVSPNSTYNDPGQMFITGWPKPISNSDYSTKGAHGVVDMNFVLENSLNTGAIFVMRQTGAKTFLDYVKNFGFGKKFGIELESEVPGTIANLLQRRVPEIDYSTASFGQGISVTPLQMVVSYMALANKGLMMKPYLVKEISKPGGEKIEIKPKPIRQVVSEHTANTVLAMLTNVVEKGHSKKAAVSGYYIGGKTGTAQVASKGSYSKSDFIHTFVGVAPIEDPKFVLLTKIDNPKGLQYAESTAVPLGQGIIDYLLKYYQVPKTRK
ncbi:MAG: penicillin-binding protein 2 [Candidatus Falkowbacteria bacterium]|nr:penicillin-binding protein 2 [Candidatus Falkowbacteria bacterium]